MCVCVSVCYTLLTLTSKLVAVFVFWFRVFGFLVFNSSKKYKKKKAKHFKLKVAEQKKKLAAGPCGVCVIFKFQHEISKNCSTAVQQLCNCCHIVLIPPASIEKLLPSCVLAIREANGTRNH